MDLGKDRGLFGKGWERCRQRILEGCITGLGVEFWKGFDSRNGLTKVLTAGKATDFGNLIWKLNRQENPP